MDAEIDYRNRLLLNLFLVISGVFLLVLFFSDPTISGASVGGSVVVPCNATITTSTSLSANMDCTGNGINIGADNIVLNCKDYTIQGNNTAYGIYNFNYSGVTVKNCKIENFSRGIYFKNTPGYAIYDNILSNNNDGIYLTLYDFCINLYGSDSIVIGDFEVYDNSINSTNYGIYFDANS